MKWNDAGTDPTTPGWYLVRRCDNLSAPPKVRAWGRNEMWWIPLADGWLTGPLGVYEWCDLEPVVLEPEDSAVSPMVEMELAEAIISRALDNGPKVE